VITGRRLIPKQNLWTLFLGMILAAHSISSIAQVTNTNITTGPPVITETTLVPRLTIQSVVGTTNQIQFATNLSQTSWTVITNLLVAQPTYWFVDVAAPASPQRFYRVFGTTNSTVILLQLWSSAGQTNLAAMPIQSTSTPTPVNTALVAFDAAHPIVWIPVSFDPGWNLGTLAYWGSPSNSMRLDARTNGAMEFTGVSGGYYGWSAGTIIVTNFSFTLTNVVSAAGNWISSGIGSTNRVTANSVMARVGDIVWVGGVGANQFQIIGIIQ
jgi:hypothetical protein